MLMSAATTQSRPILNKVKNSLQYYNRYVPILLVTGSLPNLPNKLSNALPDLETPSLREVKATPISKGLSKSCLHESEIF